MTDKIAEGSPLIPIAARKANEDSGNTKILVKEEKRFLGGLIRIPVKKERPLLSTSEGTKTLDKYEESEVHRDNSFKDPTTGLLNRRGVVEEYKLEEEVRKGFNSFKNNALIALDLIGLKAFNRDFGESVGDEVIKESASYLKKQVKEIDLVARWGGDEFLVVVFNADEENILSLISQMRKDLPDRVRFNIAYQIIRSDTDPQTAFEELMNKIDLVKEMGDKDETGRSIGNGVVVNADTLTLINK